MSTNSFKMFINLKKFKEKIENFNFDDAYQNEIKNIFLKSHFLNIIKQRKVKISENKKEIEKIEKPKKMSKETYQKLNSKKLTIIYNSIQKRPENLKNEISFHTNKKDISQDDPKDILIIEFEGILGYTRTNEKGFVEFIYLKNLANFFKKLKKHYHLVIIFKRRNASDYYKKIMEFVNKFDHFVKVFAAMISLKDLSKLEEKSKVKLGSFMKMTPRECRKISELNIKAKVINEMFIDIKEIEFLFPENKKFLFFSTLNKDFGNCEKGKSIYFNNFKDISINPESLLFKQFLVSFQNDFQYIFVRNIKFYKNSLIRHADKFVSNVLKYEDKLISNISTNSIILAKKNNK